jgi:hypothetical protein
MEALTAAIFYLVIQRPGQQPLVLEHPLPLSECLAEAKLALNRTYEIEAGARIQAGCVVTVAPSINH